MKEYTATMSYLTVLLPFLLADILFIAGLISNDWAISAISLTVAAIPALMIWIVFYRKKGTRNVQYGEERDPKKIYEDSLVVRPSLPIANVLIIIFILSSFLTRDFRTLSAILLTVSLFASIICYLVLRKRLSRLEM